MYHIADGTLRVLRDEPLALSPAERRHLASCARCRGRAARIEDEAGAAAGVLAVPEVRIDMASAYSRIQRNIAAGGDAAPLPARSGPLERIIPMSNMHARRFVKPVGGAAAAAALIAALVLTPVGSLAQSFLNIFEPTRLAAVPLTTADMQSLRNMPNLDAYGSMGAVSQPRFQQVTSAARAAAASGLTLHLRATLPSDVPSRVVYEAASRGVATFTFSAARARAAAHGKALPAMPDGLDGSSLQVTVGPAVAAIYDGSTDMMNVRQGSLPTLIIAQAAAPRVTSTGATVRQIEAYLLRLPGISPALARQIKAIGDPNATLPIPIPVDSASAQTVRVQGVSGLAIGDNTGIGSVVVWVKGGMVYGVGGTLPQDQVLAIADSLH